MPNDYSAFGPFAGAAFAGADRAREDAMRRKTQNALSGFATNPDAAITNYMAVDAPAAIQFKMAYDQNRAKTQQAQMEQQAEQRKQQLGAVVGVTDMLRRARDTGGDVGGAYDQLDQAGILDNLGMSPPEKVQYRAAILANPGLIDIIGQKAAEGVVVAPGAQLLDKSTGRVLGSTPAVPKPLVVRRGDGGSDVIYPTAPGAGGAPGAGMTAPGSPATPLTVEALRPIFKAQESGGNYTVTNKDTGALGAYQVMPQTGAAIAKTLGLAWRPDMMTRDDPASRRYQDAIGGAAIKEAIDASGGDPRVAFQYYYGGPDRSKWGPKTRQYGNDMMGRLGDGANGARQSSTGIVYSTPGAPPKVTPKDTRMTPQEVAAEGLDPNVPWYRDKDGAPKAITVPQNAQTGPTRQQIGLAKQKLVALSAIENQLDRVQRAYDSAKTKGFVGPGWGRVPFSGAFDSESATLDKSIAQIAPLIRSLTRVPGEGSMSDYESKLAEMSLPSRQDNEAGFKEAITGLRELIAQTRAGYGEMLAPAGSAAPSASTPAGAAPGSSQQNPIPIRTAQDAIKNSGKWVRTPDGRVGRAK